MKKIIAILLSATLILSGCGAANTDVGSQNSSGNNKTVTTSIDKADLVGTYVGLHGSAITLFQDGTSEYYWKEWSDVETDDTWYVSGTELVMASHALDYDIRADLSEGNTSSLTFTGEDGWVAEMFVKVDSTADHRNVDYYIDLIEKQLNIAIERPNKTSVSSIKENTIYMTDGIIFTLPERYTKNNGKDGSYTSAGSLVWFESTDLDLAIIKNIISTPDGTYGKAVVDSFKKLLSDVGTPKSESSENTTVAGMDAIIHSFEYDDYYAEVVIIGDIDNERIIAVILASEKENVYKQEFREMLSTAMTSASKNSDESKAKAQVNDKTDSKADSDGVDPDLKAFLDSYEEFADEYVAFMKKYQADPTNAIAMLGEYSEMMQKYADFADKIDKYDSNNMSTEDYKYYIEVTTRCTQKMLEAY